MPFLVHAVKTYVPQQTAVGGMAWHYPHASFPSRDLTLSMAREVSQPDYQENVGPQAAVEWTRVGTLTKTRKARI
jgi:hypothetical protein